MTSYPKDTLFICGLELTASIGVSPEERATNQRLLLDMTLILDMHEAMIHDAIEHTVDYAALSELLRQWTLDKPYKLIESLGNDLAEKTLLHFPDIETVRLTLHKFPALPLKSAGVVLTRSNIKTITPPKSPN